MTDPHIAAGPMLSEHEREILTILGEECAEVIVAISKMMRFGKDDYYPGTEITATQQLGLEIGDLEHMIDVAARLSLIHLEHISAGVVRKKTKLKQYLQTKP